MSFRPLKDLLPQAIRTAKISDQVRAAQVLALCREAIASVLPPNVAAQVQPLLVRHEAVVPEVPASAVAHELRLRQGEILSRVNRQSPFRIERLQFRMAEEVKIE